MKYPGLIQPRPQTPIARLALREVMKPFASVDELPRSLPLVKEVIDDVAAYWEIAIASSISPTSVGVRRGGGITGVHLEDAGYHYHHMHHADQFDGDIPHTSGMAMWAVMEIYFPMPEEWAAKDREFLDGVLQKPFLDAVFSIVHHNEQRSPDRPAIDIAAQFPDRTNSEVAKAIEQAHTLRNGVLTMDIAFRDSERERLMKQQLRDTYPGFNNLSYSLAVSRARRRAESKRFEDRPKSQLSSSTSR